MRPVLVALTAAGLLFATLPAQAAAKGDLHITDLAGDANGINDQELALPIPPKSTAPASIASADILGIDVTTDYHKVGSKRVARGTKVVLRLAGPVQVGINYGVTATAPASCGDSTTIQLGYESLAKTRTALAVCQAADPAGTGTTIGTTDTSGNTITWIIAFGMKPGQVITHFYASSSVFVAGVFDACSSNGRYIYAK